MVTYILPIIAGSVFVLIIIALFYVRYKANALPSVRPETYQPIDENRKRIVCIGDSITQGKRSFDYVQHLSTKFNKRGFDFINAGYGKELSWNVLQRLDPVISLQPDFITILLGSYEVDAFLSKKNEKRYKKSNDLPLTPSPEWFMENLGFIIQKLQSETTAQLALISPPLVGEDLDEENNYWSAEYATIIKKVADEYGIAYLPLNERERELLESLDHYCLTPYKKSRRLIRRAAFKRYILGKSWDEISEKNGFLLTHDLLHKNSKGGKIIVHLIERFITRVDEKNEVLETKA